MRFLLGSPPKQMVVFEVLLKNHQTRGTLLAQSQGVSFAADFQEGLWIGDWRIGFEVAISVSGHGDPAFSENGRPKGLFHNLYIILAGCVAMAAN